MARDQQDVERELLRIQPGDRLPRIPIHMERMAQFVVALAMIAAATYLLLRGIDKGGSAVWGTTIVGAVLALGAVLLAIDRSTT